MMSNDKVTFLGGGNMASAIIRGLIKYNVNKNNLAVVDISKSAREKIKKLGILNVQNTLDEIKETELLIICLKPNDIKVNRKSISKFKNSTIVSIAAGISLDLLEEWFDKRNNLVRAMPNTPGIIGKGVTGLFTKNRIKNHHKDNINKIFSSLGAVFWVNKERDMNFVTAVSGSGPAYVFYFMEAIRNTAKDFDLDDNIVKEIIVKTFLGASYLFNDDNESLEILRERVTSKRGTTEAAIKYLEKKMVKSNITKAVSMAIKRAEEINKENKIDEKN